MKICISFILLFSFILCIDSLCSADEVYSKNRKANELYKKGKYDEALKLYEDALLLSPADQKLKMNKGSALYKLGDYDKAEESYNEALSLKDQKTRADAYYNMGNILFKKAEQIQQQDLQAAQEKYKSALNNYVKSLDLSPSNIDAKWNLQLAHQKIKELQQQQQQQQQQQNQQNKDNKEQDSKDNKQHNNNENKDQQQPKDQQEQQKDKNEQQQSEQQQQQQQQAEMKESEEKKDMKKEDARRLIELYADDADSLNKPQKKAARPRQPEQDW